jgi:hypothetical protein
LTLGFEEVPYMGTKQTPGEHWDSEQIARDTEGAPPEGTPQGEVWNRHQMDIDDPGDDPDALTRTEVDEEPDAGGLSGKGQPSGESHWDRVDDTSRG